MAALADDQEPVGARPQRVVEPATHTGVMAGDGDIDAYDDHDDEEEDAAGQFALAFGQGHGHAEARDTEFRSLRQGAGL